MHISLVHVCMLGDRLLAWQFIVLGIQSAIPTGVQHGSHASSFEVEGMAITPRETPTKNLI